MIKFDEKAEAEFRDIVGRYPDDEMGRHAALLPVLTLAQREFGWISVEVMDYVADRLGLPADYVTERYTVLSQEDPEELKRLRARYRMTPEKVFTTATFYTMYNKSPVGPCHIQVCTTLSCALCGGYAVLEQIEDELGINAGETTTDGLFTLTEVECLAACGGAPMFQVTWSDGEIEYYEDLTPERVTNLLGEFRRRCESLPVPHEMH